MPFSPPIFAGVVQRSALGAFDQGLGFLFGLARGVVLILAGFILYDYAIGDGEGYEFVNKSASRSTLQEMQANVQNNIQLDVLQTWFEEKFADLQARSFPDANDAQNQDGSTSE